MTTTQAEEQKAFEQAAADGFASESNKPFVNLSVLGTHLLGEFKQAVQDRQETEERWLKDLRQYRGIYEPDVEAALDKNRSRAFVRATRVKVKTVDARVADLLFPANADRNWTAEPTPAPSLDRETKGQIAAALQQDLGRPANQLELEDAERKFAQSRADRMTRVMDDQLVEARYKETARQVLHSGHLYGTGILKAPLVERKVRNKFVLEQGKWVMKTISYVVPFVAYVPLWRWYPDMSATTLAECNYNWETHTLTRDGLAQLANRRSFNGKAIRDFILANPDGSSEVRAYDTEIRSIGDRTTSKQIKDGKYEILERWGWLSGELLEGAGFEVPEDRKHETFFANTWMLPTGEVIKCVLQPINGVTFPYHLYYTDKDETSIFGEGFASIMRGDQETINAATRMVLDHAAITAGPQLEANVNLLAPGEQTDEVYPFKVWKRNGEQPGVPALRVIELPSAIEHLFPIVQMFQNNADDTTAIPRYMQGQNVNAGAAGTASGMSMLLANASIVMKDLLTSYDAVTESFIGALYKWNMQFNPDDSIKGDYDIKARGTASLMAKEIRAQQLDQFAATIGPDDAPYIKREALLRQRAQAHDLTSIIKTEDEVKADQNSEAAKQQAELAQKLQQLQLQQAEANVAKVMGEVQRLAAEIVRIHAAATKTNVDSAYAAMQAGAVATERAHTAAAGDAILKSSGFKEATPAEPTPGADSVPPVEAGPVPPIQTDDRDPQGGQVGANVGEMAGIHTNRIEG